MKEIEEPKDDIIQEEAPKKKKDAVSKKIEINDKTMDALYAFRIMAGGARRAVDSTEYTAFYAAVNNVIGIAEYMNSKRKSNEIYDEKRAYRQYVKAVNELKERAKDYEAYKLSYRTENPKGEPGKKEVNSDDKAKLKVVRSVAKEKVFNVAFPRKTPAYPSYLKKTDEAMERLKAGNYDSEDAMAEDALYAHIGQMVRYSGGAVLIDPNTGKNISFAEYKDRCIHSDLKAVLRDSKDPQKYKSAKDLYSRLNNSEFLQQMASASVMPDDPDFKLPQIKLPKGEQATRYMLKSFAEDMEEVMHDIMKTYGKGKSDSTPSRLMKTVLNGIRDFSSKDGKNKADTADKRINEMMKLSPEEFENRLDILTRAINEYMNKRQNPSKGDRVDRNMHMMSLKRKLANYKKEVKAIQDGKSGFVHRPKIGLYTKGEIMSYPTLKKNLFAFVLDMAEKSESGADLLFRYDPESYDPNRFGNDIRPERPSAELKKVFDAFKDYRSLFHLNDNGEAPFVSFDMIKKKVTALNRAVTLYKSKYKDKMSAEYKEMMDGILDDCQDCFRNMEALQPYMDMQTVEGRIGDKNIYEVQKTMEVPYKRTILLASETALTLKNTNADGDEYKKISKMNQTRAVACGALSKEKNLLQKAVSKGDKLRIEVIQEINRNYSDTLLRPASKNISQNSKNARDNAMLDVALGQIMLKLTDDANMWQELGNVAERKKIIDECFSDEKQDLLKNNPAFRSVVDGSVLGNIGTNILKEAERLGTLDEIKKEFGPEKLRQVMKEKTAEKNKNKETIIIKK